VRRQAPRHRASALPIAGSKALTCGYGSALGGTRTPNLLIRSKIRFVQIRPSLSIRPAGTLCGDLGVPALSALVQVRC
jgi:hypothetical protein